MDRSVKTIQVSIRCLTFCLTWLTSSVLLPLSIADQHMRLYLTSVSAKEAEAAFKALPPDPPPSLLPEMVSGRNTMWPPEGGQVAGQEDRTCRGATGQVIAPSIYKRQPLHLYNCLGPTDWPASNLTDDRNLIETIIILRIEED
jgi:hypothetical protein